jgi:cytochrome c oxidase subunit I
MTKTAPPLEQPDLAPGGQGILGWVTTTDHKKIGIAYIVTAIVFFLVAGVFAELMRLELATPGIQLFGQQTYNELFTMHGTVMIFLFAVPVSTGLANYIIPLQIGAPDVAFPRLNALAYWLYLGGGITVLTGFLTVSGAADFGWFAYAPLSGPIDSPGVGADLWIIGVGLSGIAGVFAAVNLITTILRLRAPGMTMLRLPVFCWDMLVVSILMLVAFPALTATLAMLFTDRNFGGHVFDVLGGGSAVLWQHQFWYFGHPEVYIIALPVFGMVTEIFPVFSRKPVFGYRGLVLATIGIAALSLGVWAHHMFATGVVLVPFFSGLSLLIAVPTGIKFFNWIGTMWGGRISFEAPMLFAIGFLLTFLIGGLTGVMLASTPIDYYVTDTYFVVGHMHYVILGLAFGLFAGLYYWFPKMSGHMFSETLARWQFFLMLIGVNLAFMPQHLLGLAGMVRRIGDYPENLGFTTLNRVSTVGAIFIAASIVPFAWNLVASLRKGPPAGDNPWDGQTLEWATSSPPPEHNFDSIPEIRSERPVFDANHGEGGR